MSFPPCLYAFPAHSVVPNSSVTPWAVAQQAPLSMGFSRQEYWGGLLFPLPGNLPDPGIKPTSPCLTGGFFATELVGSPGYIVLMYFQISYLSGVGYQFSSVAQSCPTLCNSMDCSTPGFPVHHQEWDMDFDFC